MGPSSTPLRRRHSVSRSLLAVALTAATIGGGLALSSETASAAGPWYVAPTTAVPPGANTATCGLAAATPCATVTFVIAKGAFVNGDTINVANGTYTDRPLFAAKGANVVGASTAGTIFSGSNVSFAMGFVGSASSPVTLNNLTLTAGNTATGGALALGSGIVTTNNVDLTSSKSALGAGAYVAQAATLTMNGGTVKDNTATGTGNLTGLGGGIYVVGKTSAAVAGKLNLNGTNFTNNFANGAAALAGGNGGAIFNAGTAVIAGGTYTGNRVLASTNGNARRGEGGAIFNGPNDLVLVNAPSLTISGVTINGGLPSGQFNATAGGAIGNGEGFGGTQISTMTATNVTMSGSVASVGGGLYNGGTATLTGGSVTSNLAIIGGGVYQSPLVLATSPATLTVDGTAFTTNVAINGGAILNSRTLTVKGNAVFTGNQATSNGGAQPNGWGGAIYNGPSLAGDTPSATITDTTFNGGAVSGGNAVIGGAIANVGNTIAGASVVPGKLDLTRVTVSKNVAGAAGGVYTGGATTVTDSTFDQNQATSGSGGYGGALYSTPFPATDPANTVTIDHTAFTKNISAFVGGAIASLKGTTLVIKNGSSLTDGGAISGGGIYNAGAASVASSSVSDNDASYQGGGIYDGSIVTADTPTLTLNNATIDNNTAANSAGGLLVSNKASVTATGGTISGNSAQGAGGLLVGDTGVASFDSTDFVGNTATGSAGGAALNSGILSIAHGLISTNHAIKTGANTGLGGAIYSGSNTAGASTKLTIDASTISGNDADAASVLVTFSPGDGATNLTSIDRSTITGNTSSTNVGAIEQFHPLSITNSTITNNLAPGGPGALVMVVPASVRVAGTIIASNGSGSCSGALPAASDGGYNLSTPGDTTCGFTPAKNDVSAQPLLGPLGNNGGDTPTQLPSATSPALDRIPATTATGITDAVTGNPVTLCAAAAKDQRDVNRPQGAKCDIGSVEVVQVAPTVTGPNPVDLAVGVGAGTPGPTFTTSAATTPQATLSATGALPTGITFVDNGDGTGSLHGTPAAGTGGDYPITVKATNEAGTGTFNTVIVVHQAPVLHGPASDTYTVGVHGGPDHFSMASGHPNAVLSTSSPLPSGVTFTPGPVGSGTGDIEGTPAVGTGGVYPIVIDGTNGTAPDAHFSFTLTVNEAPTIAGPSADTFTVGTAHTTAQFTTTGTPTPTLSSSLLPAGLSLDTSVPGKATITGTPANGTGGEYDITVTAHNVVAPDATKIIHLVIREAPEITGPATVRFVAGTFSTVGYSADGYSATNMQADFSMTGALPSGVTFVDNGNGTASLAGTAAIGSDGFYPITIKATNGVSPDATLNVVLEIAPPVTITTTTLPNGNVGSTYGASVAAVGGQPAYSFTVVGGSLPAGLTMATNGTISGTPTGPTGTSNFTVQVTDQSDPQQTDTQALSITIGKGDTTLQVSPLLIEIRSGLGGIKLYFGYASATLRVAATGAPIPGQTVTIRVGTTPGAGAIACTGVTNAAGVANCDFGTATTLAAILGLGINGTYAGNGVWNPSSGTGGLLGL
jgi:hypothetical protein